MALLSVQRVTNGGSVTIPSGSSRVVIIQAGVEASGGNYAPSTGVLGAQALTLIGELGGPGPTHWAGQFGLLEADIPAGSNALTLTGTNGGTPVMDVYTYSNMEQAYPTNKDTGAHLGTSPSLSLPSSVVAGSVVVGGITTATDNNFSAVSLTPQAEHDAGAWSMVTTADSSSAGGTVTLSATNSGSEYCALVVAEWAVAVVVGPTLGLVNDGDPIPNAKTLVPMTGLKIDTITSLFLRDKNGVVADQAQADVVLTDATSGTFTMVRGDFGYGVSGSVQYELVASDGSAENAIDIVLAPEAGRDYVVIDGLRATIAERIQATPVLEDGDIVVFSTDTDTELVNVDGSVQRTGAMPDSLSNVEIWSQGDWSATTATVPLQEAGANAGQFVGNIADVTYDASLPDSYDAASQFSGSFTNSRITGTVPLTVTINAAGLLSVNAGVGDIGVYSGLTIDRFDGSNWISSNTFTLTIEEAFIRTVGPTNGAKDGDNTILASQLMSVRDMTRAQMDSARPAFAYVTDANGQVKIATPGVAAGEEYVLIGEASVNGVTMWAIQRLTVQRSSG